MPNQPRTPTRTVRVPGDLWRSARAAADAEGRTISDVINYALRQYVDRQRDENLSDPRPTVTPAP